MIHKLNFNIENEEFIIWLDEENQINHLSRVNSDGAEIFETEIVDGQIYDIDPDLIMETTELKNYLHLYRAALDYFNKIKFIL